MACGENFKSQEVNNLVGSLKRKADLDATELDCSSQVSTKSKIDDENTFTDVTKRQCSWRPPLKNEIENSANATTGSLCFPATTASSHETSSDTKTQEISTQKANDESEQQNENFKLTNIQSGSNIYRIDHLLNKDDSDKEENEDLTLGSIETLPIGVFYNNENFDIKSVDEEKNIPSHEESGNMIKNKEILSDEKSSVRDQSFDDCKEIAPDNISVNTGNTPLAESICSDEATFLEPVQVNQCLSAEEDNLYEEQKYLSGEDKNVSRVVSEMVSSMNAGSTGSNITNSTKSAIPSEQNNNVRDNSAETRAFSAITVDDTFDLTQSQLATVEGDVSSAIYHKHSTNFKPNWIRTKQEQKKILRKLIDEVDQLNKTIVQAANELKSQLNKTGPLQHQNNRYFQ